MSLKYSDNTGAQRQIVQDCGADSQRESVYISQVLEHAVGCLPIFLPVTVTDTQTKMPVGGGTQVCAAAMPSLLGLFLLIA